MTQEENYSLHGLLTAEDDPDLLRIWCPDTMVPVWSLIRVAFLRSIMSDMLFATEGLIKQDSATSHFGKLKALSSAAFHNLRHQHQTSFDICYFSTGYGNFHSEGKIEDRLVGYFAGCYPDRSLIYQGRGDGTWNGNFRHRNVLSSVPFTVLSRLNASVRVSKTHRAIATEVLEIANTNLKAFRGYPLGTDHISRLEKSLARQLAAFPLIVDHYTKWFARFQARILFKEDACYGGTSVPILHAAKLAGLTTVEFQHGAISKGHDGYNAAAALVNSIEFQKTLPDYLLTYGEWWNQQCNMPVKKVAVGNPHFTESTRNLIHRSTNKENILILGDGIDTETYLDLCGKIAHGTGRKARRVLFRPHPIERAKVSAFRFPPGVKLDVNADIYRSLSEASLVISELSTGLFEAAGMNCTVLLWSTPKSRFAFPDFPFRSFSSVAELEFLLEAVLTDTPSRRRNVASDQIWAPEWEANFRNFIEGVLSN